LTWIAAVDVIIAAPAAAVPLEAKNCSIALIACQIPSVGGPNSSTAPPGSTVMALPPGSGAT
jgi:hypothetical protein